jgi:NHLM bacteriocin system ABC transporter ATP-binding protein
MDESLNFLNEIPSTSVEVESNYRRFLSYKDALWWIKKGEGAVFAMERTGLLIEGGRLNKGPLHFLASASKDNLIFGFDNNEDDPLALMFITHSKTELKKIKLEDLKNFWMHNQKFLSEIAKLFEKWINGVFFQIAAFKEDVFDKICQEDLTYEVQKGAKWGLKKSLDPLKKDDVVWIEVLSGSVNLFGIDGLELCNNTGPFPLSRQSFVKASSHAVIKTYSTINALNHEEFIQGFITFQDYTLKLIESLVNLRKQEDLKRLETRQQQDLDLMETSLRNISSVLALDSSDQITFDINSSNLFKAMTLLGASNNIKFINVENPGKKESVEESIEEIAENSAVKFRKVILNKDFWKLDSRCLLAFLKKDLRPVALLNKNGKKYFIHDPATNKKRVLNEESFKELNDEAFMFYEPFENGPMNGSKILKFCFKGMGKEVLMILLFGLLGALINLLPPLLNEKLFNRVIGSNEPSLLGQVILGFVVAATSSCIFALAKSFSTQRLTSLIDFRLESAVWDRILSLPMRFFRQFTTGNLIERVYAVSQIHQIFTGSIIRVVIAGIFSLFYFFSMFYFSSTLAFAAIIIVLLCGLISAGCVFKKALIQKKLLHVGGIINGLVVQLIGGISRLRVSGAENRGFAKWVKYDKEVIELSFESQKVQNIVILLTNFLPILTTAFLFSITVIMLENNSQAISLGALVAFFAAFIPFSQAVYDMINTLLNIVQVVPLWQRARVILEAEPEENNLKLNPGKLDGSVLIEKMSFKFDDESPLVLDDVTIKIEPKEFIAIVGPSGSGKTTLVKLLLGFEKPYSGNIYYNQLDINDLDLRRIRKQIGTVLQNDKIFSGSIYENIVCNRNFSDKSVSEVLRLSGLEEDIKNMPMGLHTFIQNNSSTLSGGQIQRVLIARAIIAKPKILIFDEATSALDNKNQEIISCSLEALEASRIVIAHRLVSVKNADRIYVLDKGKIVQKGRFDELKHQEGLFKKMLERQKF